MRIIAVLVLLAAASGVAAQESQPAPILTVDQERLFAETNMGARVLSEIEEETRALAAENRRLEAELIAEERELTERRAETAPEVFADIAAEFDDRVRRLRAEQDAKVRDIARLQDEARAAFFDDIGDILARIMTERGADMVVDRRSVFLSSDRVDVTDEAIERVNEALGDGEGRLPEPLGDGTTAE